MLKTLQSLQGVSVLSKAAQKEVNGGKGTCAVHLPPDWVPDHSFSYSASRYTKNSDGSITIEGVSRGEADHFMSSGGQWCCSSCGTASWL